MTARIIRHGGHDKVDPTPNTNTDYFEKLYVVRQAAIEFSDGTTVQKRFEWSRNTQWCQLDHPEITKTVRIEIKDTYEPRVVGPDEAAISEIKVR